MTKNTCFIIAIMVTLLLKGDDKGSQIIDDESYKNTILKGIKNFQKDGPLPKLVLKNSSKKIYRYLQRYNQIRSQKKKHLRRSSLFVILLKQ